MCFFRKRKVYVLASLPHNVHQQWFMAALRDRVGRDCDEVETFFWSFPNPSSVHCSKHIGKSHGGPEG